MSKIASGLVLCVLSACVALDDGSDSRVDAARIIAVVASPPEVTPGVMVHFDAIIAAPDGAATPTLDWSFCDTARASTDNGAVAPSCARNAQLPLLGAATEVDARVPSDACKIFGSETPAGSQPNRADATGGYYQPLRVAFVGDVAIARQRIRCALAAAPIDVARAFAQQYLANRAPDIAALRVFAAGQEVDPAALPTIALLHVRLEVDASAREPYSFYDVHSGQLTTRQETLSTHWFVTGGMFRHASLSVSGDSLDNELLLDAATSDATVWVVLRDDRGGASVARTQLHRQ